MGFFDLFGGSSGNSTTTDELDTWDEDEQRVQHTVKCPNCGNSHEVYFDEGQTIYHVAAVASPRGVRLDSNQLRTPESDEIRNRYSERVVNCGCKTDYHGDEIDDIYVTVRAKSDRYFK